MTSAERTPPSTTATPRRHRRQERNDNLEGESAKTVVATEEKESEDGCGRRSDRRMRHPRRLQFGGRAVRKHDRERFIIDWQLA